MESKQLERLSIFDSLTPKQKRAFELRLSGHTHQDIACVMGVTKQAITMMLGRARRNIELASIGSMLPPPCSGGAACQRGPAFTKS